MKEGQTIQSFRETEYEYHDKLWYKTALKAGKACVVNYEQIEALEQRRICDFVNGVCYVLDGSAKRVSNQIMLYVPNGVDVAEAMTMALTD